MDERIALLSVQKDGDIYYFNVGDKTVKDMLAVVENDNATYADYSALGKRIDEFEYVEIQQSDKFTQSVEVNLDGYEKKADIYIVNGGKGGIAEGDRDNFNSSITYYTYDAEIKGLIWKDYGDGSMSAEYYGEHVCSVDHSTNEYNIGGKGWDVIDTGAPDDNPANYRRQTREYVKTLPKYKEINSEKEIPIKQSDIDVIRGLSPKQSVLSLNDVDINKLALWKERFSILNEKSPFYRKENGDWRENEQTKINILHIPNDTISLKKIKDDIKNISSIYRGETTNNDTGIKISVSRRGLEDTYTYAKKNKDDFSLNALYKIKDLIKSSIFLDTNISQKNNSNKANNSVFMHKFYCPCLYKQKLVVAKLTIEEFATINKGTQYRLYNVQIIKEKLPKTLTFTTKGLALQLSDSTISIADLYSFVKRNDKNFYAYEKNEASQQKSQEKPPMNEHHDKNIVMSSYDIDSDIQGKAERQADPLKNSKEAQFIIKRNEKEDYLFRRQIENFTDPNYAFPKYKTIKVCSTPNILLALGSKAEALTITQSVLRNSIQGMGNKTKKHTEPHEIKKDVIISLSSEIRTPILAITGHKRNINSVVLIVEARNTENNNIFVPVSFNKEKGNLNVISSLYGRKNLAEYLSKEEISILAINTEKAGKLFAEIGLNLSKSELDLAIRFDNSIAYTMANVKYPDEKNHQKTQQEDIKMDEQNVSMEILNELKALREQVSRLEQRANDSEQKLDAISAYIAAGNEAQSFEKTMHVTEIVTQQITNCDKAQFYALDADNRFFTTDGDKREYQNADNKTNALLRSMEEKNVSINDVETAYIPVVSKENKAIGVIVAEKSGGFEGVDFTQFGKDKAIMSQIDLAVKKELAHQEAITDILTGLKNEKGLAEYIAVNTEKTVTVMEVTVPSDLPKENADDIIKTVAKTVESKGRSNINDNIYAVGGGKFVVVMNCPEKKAQNIAEMLKMAVRVTNITTNVKQMKVNEIQVQKAQTSIKKVQARNVDPKTTLKNDFTKAEKLEDFAKSANKYFSNIGNKITNTKGEEKNNCYAIYAQDKIGERVKIYNHDNKVEVQLGKNKDGQYAGKPFALVIDKSNKDNPVRFYVNNLNDLKSDAVKPLPAEVVTVISQFKEFDKPRKEQPNIDDITSGVLAEDIERYCDNGKEIEKQMVEEIKKEQDKNEVGGDVGGDR